MTDRPTNIRWRICVLIGVASFVAYVLRTNMSVAGAPMSQDLGLTQVQLGLVLAAFAWAYALFQFPGGVFGDVLGARRAVTVLAVAWGLVNLLVAAVPARGAASTTALLLVLVGARILMGIAQAPFFPITGGAATCNWFPVAGWGLPGSFQNAGLTFGSAAAGPLIAWLTVRYGWRQSFALTAPLGFLTAAVWWWYVRDYPSQHPHVNRAERDLIDADRPPGDIAPREPGAWRAVLRHRPLLVLTLGYTCSNYVFYFFFNWLFIYLIESRGFKLLEGGFYAAAPWITGAFGAVLGGLGLRPSVEAVGSASRMPGAGRDRDGAVRAFPDGRRNGADPDPGGGPAVALPGSAAVRRPDLLGRGHRGVGAPGRGGVRRAQHRRQHRRRDRRPGGAAHRPPFRLDGGAGDRARCSGSRRRPAGW